MKISTCHCLQDFFSYVKEFLILHLQMAANCTELSIYHHVSKSLSLQCYGIWADERRRSRKAHFKWEEREEREANTQYPNLRPIHQRLSRREELCTVNGKITNLSCGEGSVGTSFIILLWNMLEDTRIKKRVNNFRSVPKLASIYMYLPTENICLWYLLESFHHISHQTLVWSQYHINRI